MESAYTVKKPSYTGDDEEYPLVSAHFHVHQRLIQQLCFGSVDCITAGLIRRSANRYAIRTCGTLAGIGSFAMQRLLDIYYQSRRKCALCFHIPLGVPTIIDMMWYFVGHDGSQTKTVDC